MKTFTIQLAESDLNVVITGLWLLARAEREHFRQIEGKFGPGRDTAVCNRDQLFQPDYQPLEIQL